MTAVKEQTLASIPLLASLPESELDELEKRCRWRRYAANEQIIDQYSDSHDVFFVIVGSVRVVIYSVTGREISFDEIEAGGLFGELAAIDGDTRSASVVALRDTLVATLPQEAFLKLVMAHAELGLAVMRRLVHVIRTSTHRIMDLSTLGANNRVMAELLREARRAVRNDNTARISPIPIHSDMASRASTTRETVARVMSALTKNGFVRREKDALVVLDVAQLEEMVEHFDPV